MTPAQRELAEDLGMAALVTVTILLIPATPVAFMLIMAGEAFDAHGDRLHYHWLAFIPLVVVVLIWVPIVMAWRKERKARARGSDTL